MFTHHRDGLRRTRMLALSLCLIAAVWASIATNAFAAGTGDDPTPTEDVLTRAEAAQKARLERETDALLTKRGKKPDSEITPLVVDAPYRYLYTPSHKQETDSWCGPATCQVIDHYFGSYLTQSGYKDFLGTSDSGTDFSRVDDCLRYYTLKPYYYYGGLTEYGLYARISDSIMNHGMPLAVDVSIIASMWPNYNHSHSGHIVPLEAFDWRAGYVRLNDVYNEADWYADGGYTFGHTSYDRSVIWNGVYSHFRRAVVSAP